MSEHEDLPLSTDDWTKEHVKQWITQAIKDYEQYSGILYNEHVDGATLKLMKPIHLKQMGIHFGPAVKITTMFTEQSTITAAAQETSEPCVREKHQEAKVKKKKQKNLEQSKPQDKPANGNTQAFGDRAEKKDITEITSSKVECETYESQQTLHDQQAMPTCMAYPFDSFYHSKRYTEHHLLSPESGICNLIDPVHEFKLFTNTGPATKEELKAKFCNETFRFAAACMNSRTNGTIHFGVRDKPHGEIVGVEIDSKPLIIDWFNQMIVQYFDVKEIENIKQLEDAKHCIRQPRFVDVLNQNNTPTKRFVIEVDVVPKSSFCKKKTFFTHQQNHIYSKSELKEVCKRSKEMSCFVRDGASSKDLFANAWQKHDYKRYLANLPSLDEHRQTAEEDIRLRQRKEIDEGPKLVSLITGNREKLDNSFYKRYILVLNKCHSSQLPYLDFLKEIQWFAVFEFDPESVKDGVCKSYREERAANLYFPHQFQDMDDSTAEKIEKLKLYQQTSWILCNGRADLGSNDCTPLEPRLWRKERAAEVKKLISFFSRKDIMERGRFLVVFLLLSTVEDPADPIVATFQAFYEELNGTKDILCLCENEETGQRWKDLQANYVSADDIAERCICSLSLEEINGTILKLKSIRKSLLRFLPSTGSSSMILPRKEEDLMSALQILCENECDDTDIENDPAQFNQFKIDQEKHFYRGGQVSWWNFYFSSKHHSVPFIKRDIFERLEELIMSWSRFEKQICVKIITLYHHPGCGGTTLCMHLLWNLKKKFRCAILKNKTSDFAELGRQIAHLATYGFSTPSDYFPVLLLIDDLDEEENVYILQNYIQATVADKYIRHEKPVVLILNCMRSQNPTVSSKNNSPNSVALTHVLSNEEQRAFTEKLKEIETEHQCPDDFYSFMIMKSNFDNVYIQKLVRNTLKGLIKDSREAQLISYLALLSSISKYSTISLSQCEEFLGIAPKSAFWGNEKVEDKMEPYICILIWSEVEEYGGHEGLRIVHHLIAKQCLEELRHTYHLNKSTIMLQLLERESIFHRLGIGRDQFLQNLQSMLITRQRKEHGDDTDTLFSPLIEAIQEGECNSEAEKVLVEGTKTFQQNPFIFQALARHLYIREKNFAKAIECAKKAKQIAPDNSFLSDTLGQVYKAQFKSWMEANLKKKTVTSDQLKVLLDIAVSASDAFKECQEQTKKKGNVREEWQNLGNKRRYEVYNTAGFLGQIEICLYTVSLLELVPCFHKSGHFSKAHLIEYLSGSCDFLKDSHIGGAKEFLDVLREYHHYINNLICNLKTAFDFFDDYFVHFKIRNTLKESAELKIRKKVSDSFRKYTQILLDRAFLGNMANTPKRSAELQTEQCRVHLEASKSVRFAGLLEYLNGHEKDQNKLEDIVKKYEFLLQQKPDIRSLRDKQNFIMANIILNCMQPHSNHICATKTLKGYLRDILRQVGLDHQYTEPYFLASLLFWPRTQHKLDDDSLLMEKYVSSMKHSFKKQYQHVCRAKQTIAHFYLGKGMELDRFIHKGKIDQYFSHLPPRGLYSLWQTGDIWKERDVKDLLLRLTGRTEDDLVYVECGSVEKIKIPVRPVYLGQLRSGRSIERVSFYLGFSIEGLIAYNIESI
ncbi:sterile alpha motif domain-containing protein 9-like [Ambystoma mexicanum]|uniref:sterile alpha motif domain-containing protein 9-like n=1 Tax=Ambystoma mexicanum TaxID=8296 RepID=UPI0037E80964